MQASVSLHTGDVRENLRLPNYCYGMNLLNFGVEPARNGRMAAILDFRHTCNVLHMKQVHPNTGISSKVTVGLAEVCDLSSASR